MSGKRAKKTTKRAAKTRKAAPKSTKKPAAKRSAGPAQIAAAALAKADSQIERERAELAAEDLAKPAIVLRSDRAAERYENQKRIAAERSKEQSKEGRDIGKIPPVADPARRERGRDDLAFALKTYFPDAFPLDWSDDHLRIIARMQTIIRDGGLLAMAMPRGSGKSTLAECVATLAVLYGFRKFVVLIGAEKEAAVEMLDSIKMELEENEHLAADFPEVVIPIRKLEGIANRCAGQLCGGKRTHILWTQTAIVLPSVEGSAASGAIIRVAGITGRIRGMKIKRPDGTTARPDFVVPDDPQTDDSARSAAQCEYRESVLAGAVLGLAGPGKKIAGVMPCTIIRPDDVCARILDRKRNPEWNGETTRMVYQWPTTPRAETLWKQYKKIRDEGMRRGDDGRAGTAFYKKHRAEMDEGAVVGWEARKNADELSALQHAYNLRFRNESVFFAEYQNDPRVDDETARALQADEIVTRLNGMPRGIIPKPASLLTIYIDVQLSVLFWTAVAWRDDFTGDVLGYGCFPDQGRAWFTVRDAQNTLARKYPDRSEEATILAGLSDLAAALIDRDWQREDGAILPVDRLLIDADFKGDLVYQFARRSPHRAIIIPAHSQFVGPHHKPFSEYKKHPGDRLGLNWRIPAAAHKSATRHVSYDVNWWKSFCLKRLTTPVGTPGAIQIHGDDPAAHRLLGHHLSAEYPTPTQGRGRTVDVWQNRPGHTENHWWDCLVGCAVAANMAGANLPELGEPKAEQKPRRVKLSDLQKQKRAGRARP